MQIPYFRYPHVFQEQRRAVEEALLRTASSGSYILQSDLREFEERLAEYYGARYTVGVGNATDALELSLQAAGIQPGDEVLLPSHSFVASASAVVAVGAKPVFVEIGSDHLIDPDDIEHRLTDRTKVIMPTQLNGRMADMNRIAEIAKRHQLIIVEDSAQGLGSRFCGRMAGTFGVAGVISFYPAKMLGCLGDGGAVVTDEQGIAEEVRELRDHGRNPKTGEVVRWGRNSRLDNLQAAVLLVKLAKIDDAIATRRRLAARYHEGLKGIAELVLPPPPDDSPGARHYDVFQNYEIEAQDRNHLRDHLSNRGVGTMYQWGGKGIHQFSALGIRQSLPVTEAILGRSLMLPMNTSVTADEVDYICDQVAAFYGT